MKTKAEIQRKYRLKKAIKDIIVNHYDTSYFLTITFNEETLKNTTKEKRIFIVKSFLNNQTDKYILNCDYGAKNGREHYHALTIINDKFINFSLFNDKYGHIHKRPINLNKLQSKESQIKIMLNHELKETSEGIIYFSRAKRPTHKPKNKNFIRHESYLDKSDYAFYKGLENMIDSENFYKTPINKDMIKFFEEEQKEMEEFNPIEEEQERINKYANDFLSFKRHR